MLKLLSRLSDLGVLGVLAFNDLSEPSEPFKINRNTRLPYDDVPSPICSKRGWKRETSECKIRRPPQKVLANIVFWVMVASTLAGCSPPPGRLDFPSGPIERSQRGLFYDMHHSGKADFALLSDEQGKLDVLAYADLGNGEFNRKYRLSEYGTEKVPHLIILLDSIPYQKLVDAYAEGKLAWFDKPAKVIPPFPSMTELIFTNLLHAPPLPGMIDQYYDSETGVIQNDLLNRVVHNYREPWERRLHYDATMFQSALSYLDPRPWMTAELQLAKESFDASPDRVTLVYFTSASSMLSRYGERGFNDVIDGIERLCMKVFYDRQGAVKISICADHGHNLMASRNVRLEEPLVAGGFHPAASIKAPNDVVLEINGLVTYAAVRTRRAADVARILAADPHVELATYVDGERVIVRTAQGCAAIECRHHKVRYVPIRDDALGYEPVIRGLQASGKADADGFASDADWFSATLDHPFPDAPRRLWDAFHGTVIHTPEVLLTLHDGFCAGNPEFEKYIHMASTHGGLNQINSATFVMTMTGRVTGPMKSHEILHVIEPGYEPVVRDR